MNNKGMPDFNTAIEIADRPQGEWIIEIDVNGNTYGRCSICGMRQYAGQLNFCPDCGARMEKIGEELQTCESQDEADCTNCNLTGEDKCWDCVIKEE